MIGDFMQFIREIHALFRIFSEDGYLHLLMEPLFTYGIGFSLLLFIVSIVVGERKCRTLALLLIIACSIFVYPYQHKRNEGAPRPGYDAYWTAENQKLWDRQTERRSHFQYVYYLLAIGALLNVVISPDGLIGKGLALGVIGGGVFVLVCGLWLDLHEKRIFHPDLRNEPLGSGGPITQIVRPAEGTIPV
jgi:hypothetical protein